MYFQTKHGFTNVVDCSKQSLLFAKLYRLKSETESQKSRQASCLVCYLWQRKTRANFNPKEIAWVFVLLHPDLLCCVENIPEPISVQNLVLPDMFFLWIHLGMMDFWFQYKSTEAVTYYTDIIYSSDQALWLSLLLWMIPAQPILSLRVLKDDFKKPGIRDATAWNATLVNWLRNLHRGVNIWGTFCLCNVSRRKSQQRMLHAKSSAPSFPKGPEIAPSNHVLSKWFKRRKESC